jgi:hypothetical protein
MANEIIPYEKHRVMRPIEMGNINDARSLGLIDKNNLADINAYIAYLKGVIEKKDIALKLMKEEIERG